MIYLNVSRQGAKLFPLILFIIIWVSQVFFYFLNPFYYKEITFYTWIIIFIGVFSFITGYLTSYFFKFDRHLVINNSNDTVNKLNFPSSRIRNLIIHISIIVIFAMFFDVVLIISTIKKYNLDPTNIFWYRLIYSTFARNLTRWNFIHSILNYLITLNLVSIILSAIYSAIYKGKMSVTMLPLLLALTFSIITLQRYLFTSSLIIWLISFFFVSFNLPLSERIKTLKRFVEYIGIMVIIIATILILIISIRINIDLGGVKTVELTKYVFKSIYTYFVGNIVALDNYLQRDILYKYGAEIFQSVFKWLGRLGLIESKSISTQYLEFTDIGNYTVNTYTFIRNFYEDFGEASLVTYAYLWGFITSYAVEKLFQKFSFARLFIASYLVFALFISFFSFVLLNISMFFLLVIYSWIIGKILTNQYLNKLSNEYH